ncbi:hypothetical protein ACKKBG_A18630 [Auxenochlorella protothecoides x Auxenochlorella symbiontica]
MAVRLQQVLRRSLRLTSLQDKSSACCLSSTSAAHQSSSNAAAATPEPLPTHTARFLDGRAAAADWHAELARESAHILKVAGRRPGLGVVLVGDRPDSKLYVTRKREACEKVGISERLVQLPDDCSIGDVQRVVGELCADPGIDGVLVQLPLPPDISEERVMESFDPSKDIDGFHPLNMGRMLMRGRSTGFVPATALGTLRLLAAGGVELRGASVVVVGDSNTVGTPLAALMRDAGAASVTVVHRTSYSALFADALSPRLAAARVAAAACAPRVPPGPSQAARAADVREEALEHLAGLPGITRTADVLVVAVGYPRLVRASWVKPGAAVVDVGINVEGGRVVGDVDEAGVAGVAGVMTPVPGGVGPMTIAATLHNVVASARDRLLGPREVPQVEPLGGLLRRGDLHYAFPDSRT